MTDEQRESAIEIACAAFENRIGTTHGVGDGMRAALNALLSKYVVIPKDDVTEEREQYGLAPDQRSTRLVTHWQPTTRPEASS